MPVTRPYPRVPASARPADPVATPERFTFFWFGPFSQWHRSPFTVDGELFENGEKWMMIGKARLFGDEEIVDRMLKISDPKALKALGRDVKGFVEETWVDHRVPIVLEGNRHKFDQNPKLKEALLATEGTTLVEASKYDRIWGIGLEASDPRAHTRATWRGLNLLGDEVLTRLRDDYLLEMSAGLRP